MPTPIPAAAPAGIRSLDSAALEQTGIAVPLGPPPVDVGSIPRSTATAVFNKSLPFGRGIVKLPLAQSFRPLHVQIAPSKQ
nr:uncharacterized protein CTRU02_13941 [Colletotrichum truncatum]KAF6782784.1 hypothetical protein CTRU02_13941 [Colletotrichum truncatum]